MAKLKSIASKRAAKPVKAANAMTSVAGHADRKGRRPISRGAAIAEWSPKRLLRCAHALDEWAFAEAEDHPNLFAVIQTTRRFQRVFLMTHFVWAALQHSPRRIVSGKNSAIEHLEERLERRTEDGDVKYLEAKVPRSTVYKFLNEDLGLVEQAAMDWFLCCRNIDEVIDGCEPLKKLALEVRALYEENREAIESIDSGI